MRRRLFGSLGLAATIMLLSANVAAADVTLGTTDIPEGASPSPCIPNAVLVQATSDPSIPYAAPGRGVITGWEINPLAASPGDAVTLVVVRPAAGGTYSVVGVDAETISAAGASFSASISVEAGDVLGLYTGSTEPPFCYWSGGPASATLAGLLTLSHPSAGQTLAPGGPNSPGGYMMNVAATFKPADAAVQPPPPPPVLTAPASDCTVLRLARTPVSVARNVLSALGCKTGKTKRVASRKIPKGTVIRTTTKPGTYPAGQKVGLVVSKGPEKRKKKQKKAA